MKHKLLLLVGLVALAAAVPVYAHHSFAAIYYEDKTQTVEGNLVQFLMRNPHSLVHIEGPDAKGVMQRWAVEWAGGLQLNREGVTRDTLKVGDHVVITGNPGRNADDHRIRLRSIARPKDGWKWNGNFK